MYICCIYCFPLIFWMHIYLYKYIFIHISRYICMYIYICIYIYTYVYLRTHLYTYSIICHIYISMYIMGPRQSWFGLCSRFRSFLHVANSLCSPGPWDPTEDFGRMIFQKKNWIPYLHQIMSHGGSERGDGTTDERSVRSGMECALEHTDRFRDRCLWRSLQHEANPLWASKLLALRCADTVGYYSK